MQDDYNRFIKRSIQQARCNYEDIFALSGDDDEATPCAAGCMGTEAAQMDRKKNTCMGNESVQMGRKNACMGNESTQMGRKNTCMGNESAQMGMKDSCMGVEAAQMGMKNKGNGVLSAQTEKKPCCGMCPEQEESCMRDKMYRPECELPVMVFIEPQTFGRMYNEAEGLKRGTLFPVLDKPFYGKGGKC